MDMVQNYRDGVNQLCRCSNTGGVPSPDYLGIFLDSRTKESQFSVERGLLWRLATALAIQRAALLHLNFLASRCSEHWAVDGCYDSAEVNGHLDVVNLQIIDKFNCLVVDEVNDVAYTFTCANVRTMWENDCDLDEPDMDSYLDGLLTKHDRERSV